jgi:hypothetical protein
VNFTREPIIETVITPKEGYKLLIKNSKGGDEEEYLVDAIEIVVFGRAYFFRSQERGNPFLFPVSDYTVIEVKEMKVALKNVSMEKSIKIGGGSPNMNNKGDDNMSDRRRNKRRRKHFEDKGQQQQQALPQATEAIVENNGANVEEVLKNKEEDKQPPVFKKMFPPPSTLIKEKLHQAKDSSFEEVLFPEEVEQEDMVFDEHEIFHPPEEQPPETHSEEVP